MRKGLFYTTLSLVAVTLSVAAPAVTQESSDDPLLLASMGRASFHRYCASCHGRQADGNGTIASMLKVDPADLRVLTRENDGQYPAERVAEFIDGRRFVQAHGQREMPVWGEVFQTSLRSTPGDGSPQGEERVVKKIKELTAFIKSIQLPAESEPAEAEDANGDSESD